MNTEIKIEGDRLAEALRGRVENMQDGAAAAMGRACQIVVRSAKKYAPKDTGLLRRSIAARVVSDGGDVVGQVGTNVHYAIHVEYGHRIRDGNKNKPGRIKYVPGVYFLSRALRENKNKVYGAILEGLMRDD